MPRFLKNISVVRAATCVALALSLWSSSRLVAQEQPQPQDPIKQRIFVPWTDLETLIDRDRRGVLLPNADFQKLFEAARQHAGENPKVDEGYAVTRVDYVGRLADDQLLLTATVEFTVFTPGWKAIPLGWKGLSVERATVGDQAAQLGRSGDADRPLYLLENRPGKRTFTVELSRTLDSAGSDKFASFGLTSAPTGTFEITLPAEKHLQFDGLPIERTAAHDQPAKYQLPIGGRKTLSLRITDRPTQQTSEGLVFATSAMALRVEPEEVTWQDITRLQVYGKPLDQLSFTIPTELALVSVTSPGLEKWEFAASEDDPEKTILKLSYRQPFQEARAVNIAGVLPVKARKWTAPTLKLANATAHTAVLVVSRPAGLRLRLDEAIGASRASAEGAQIPQSLAAQDGQPALEAPTPSGASASDVKTTYHAWREDFTLSFTTEEKARELQAAISTLLNISAQGLDLRASIGVQTRFAPLFEIGLTLPAEWSVVEIRKDGQTVAWQSVPEKAGVHELRIPFDPPLPVGQAAAITLVAHRDLENWPVEEGSVSFALPEVQLLQADVVEGTYQVLAEKDLQVVANQVRGLDPANAAVPAGQEIPRLSYEYQDAQFTGELSISRKPSRIAAISLAYLRLDRETLSSHLEALLHVEGGGIRRLDLSLPESAGNDLRFQLVDSPVQIVEQTAAAPANGRRVWTLQFDQRVTGALRVAVDVETKRGDAKDFQPPLLTIPAAERESSRIAVEAATDQELDITAVGANGEPLIEMDPADLPAPRLYFPRERIVAAYGGTAPGAKITLRETRFERDAVPTAICEHLQIESVLGETGEFQHRATYAFRAVGVQNLLAALPETGLLWAAVVDGQPVEVRKADAGYLIPLPHVADVAASRSLQLFYRTEVGRMSAAGRLQQSPPRVSAVNGEGQEQPMDVLQQHWTVHHPGETEFIASRAQFQPDQPLAEAGFLGSLQRSFGVDSPVNLGWKLLGLVIVFAVLGFAWMGHRRFGIPGLACALGVVLFGCFAFVAFFSFASQENISREYLAGGTDHFYPAPTAGAPPTGESAPATRDRMHGIEGNIVKDDEGKKADAAELYGRVQIDAPQMQQLELPPVAAQNGLSLESQNEAMRQSGRIMFGTGKNTDAGVVGGAVDPRDGSYFQNEFKGGTVRQRNEANLPRSQGKFHEALGAPQAPPLQAEVAALDEGGAMPQPRQPNARPEADQAPDPAVQRPAAPQAVAGPGPGIIHIPAKTSPAAGGLMSLSLHLEPPPGGRTTQLTYTGVAGAEAPQMDLRYENRRQLSYITLFVEIVVVIVFWWLRRASLSTRIGLAACGLCLPIGLASTAPLATLPYLDGILFGSVAGLVLWLVAACVHGWRTYCVRRPIWAAPSATLLLALALGLSADTARAQDPAPASGPQPAQPQVAPRVDPPFGGRNAVIVPYEEGTDPLKAEKIYLPYDRFVELWNQAHPDRLLQGAAPVDGLVDEALYAVEVVPFKEGQPARANVTARIVLTSFRKDQIQLPLPLGRVAFQSAQLDGKSAALITPPEADKPLEVALTGAGTHVLDLKFAVAVERIGPAGRLMLPLKPVPSGLLRFVLPAADLTVRVNGGGAFRRTKLGDDQLVLIPVDQGGDVTVAWQPAQTRAAVEGTIHAEIAQALVIDDSGVRLAASSIFRVRQGSLSEALFALPAPLAVRRISGPDVGGWEIEGEGDKRTLRVFLRRKVEDETTLNFDLYLGRKLEDVATSVTLPAFAPLGVTRETGAIGVFASSEFSVHAGIISGLNQIDAKNFPLQRLTPPPTGLPQIAWHYSSRPIQLEIQVKRRIPQLRATVDHQAFVESRKIAIHSRFNLSLSGAPRSEIAIRLPKEFLVDVVQSPVLSDWYVTGREAAADGPNNPILHVELTEPRTGSLELTLDGKLTRDPDKTVVPLEFPQPLGVDEMVSTTAVALDAAFQGQIAAHPTWRSIDPAQLNPLQCGNLGRAAQFAFHSSNSQPEGLALDVTRAKPSLNANVLAMVAIDDDGVHDTFAFQWDISLAGAETFTFTAPSALDGRLEFPELGGPRIRNVSQNDAGNGRTRWTLTLEQPLQNRYFVVATAVLPLPADGMVRAPNFVFEQSAAQGAYEPLAVQGEYVLLANRSQFQVAPQAREGIESISADDLQHVMKVRPDLIDQAAEIVRIRDPRAVVAWKLQRMKAEKLLPAVINLSNQITVLAADGSWRAQAMYRIRNRSRQFLALQMPEGSRILSLFVRNLPARPVHTTRNGRNLELIPLPKTIEGDLSFDVTLVFSGRLPDGALPKGFHVARRTLDIPSPHVLQQSEDAEFGMPTAQTTWTVYLPESLDVEVLTDPGRTNVNYVTEAEQQMEQTTAFLNDLSVLCNLNSSTSNRRARAQSLNNLKQSGIALHNYAHNPQQSGLNPQDQLRQQGLQMRAEKLAKTISELETKNAEEGLVVQSDALGNTVVLDIKSRGDEQQAAQSLWDANNDAGTQPQNMNGKPSISTADAANQNPAQNYRQQLKSKAQSQSGMLNSEAQQLKDHVVRNRTRTENSLDGQKAIDPNAMLEATDPRSYTGSGNQPSGKPPVVWHVDNVPPGFTINAETGQFSSGMTKNLATGGQFAVTQNWNYMQNPQMHNGAGIGGPQNGMGVVGLGGGGAGGGAAAARQPVVMGFAAPPGEARDFDPNPNFGEQPPAWTAVGGLSLYIDIPKTGQKLTFAKVTGDARLGLGVRPHETLEKGIGLLWTIAWLALLVGAFWLMRHPERRAKVLRVLPVSLAVLGGLVFLLLPGQSVLGWLAFWVFLIATAVALFSRRNVRTA